MPIIGPKTTPEQLAAINAGLREQRERHYTLEQLAYMEQLVVEAKARESGFTTERPVVQSYAMGYCQLCREEEIRKYGMLTDDMELHVQACEAAGCRHPAYYH